MPLGGYSVVSTYKWIMAIVISVLFIYSSGLFRRMTYFTKSKTRVMYHTITVFTSATMLFMLISPAGFKVWYLLTLLNVSLVLSRMLDRKI